MEKIELGPTPYDEPCQQLGAGYDPERARLECRTFIDQLRREFGHEPEGARLCVISNQHDFGAYYEVACKVDNPENERAMDYAFRCEADSSPRWDAQSRVALNIAAESEP